METASNRGWPARSGHELDDRGCITIDSKPRILGPEGQFLTLQYGLGANANGLGNLARRTRRAKWSEVDLFVADTMLLVRVEGLRALL